MKLFNQKKRIRNVGKIVIALMFCTIFSGCQTREDIDTSVSGNGKLQIVTTIFPYYDFVRQVAGEYADVKMIVPAGMDTHSFEPTAEDMMTIGKADVFIYNGGEMENWVPKVIDAAGNDSIFADSMMDYVETFTEEQVKGMEAEEADTHAGEGSDEEEYDEHIWTSPKNAQDIVAQIAKDLSKADAYHKEQYLENAQNYIEKLEKLDGQFEEVLSKTKNHYLVFGDRFPLRYFVEAYDLEYTAAFAGCSSETEPSAETVAYLTDQVKKRQIPVVLKIELTSSRVADTIAEASGAKVETFFSCHNVTKAQFDEGVTYLSLMEQNISVLKDALGINP